MSTREKAIAAMEGVLLNAALSHGHRAEQIVQAVENAGLVVVEECAAEAEAIARRIEGHANISDRPGQHDELRDLAGRVRKLGVS